MTVLSNLFALLLVLCILVLLHEWGHFITARLFGIRPYIFSFGIGWRLVGIQKRAGRWRIAFGPPKEWVPPDPDTGTDFRISMIPFGGYVMLQGESLSESVTGDAKEFRTRPRWQQLIVYGAGVTLNIVLAWALITGQCLWTGFAPADDLTGPLVVQTVQPGSGAEKAGLHPGDQILQIEGRSASDPMVFTEQILYAPNTTKNLLVERDGVRTTIQLPIGMDSKYHIGIPDFTVRGRPMVMAVGSNTPAERAGLRAGDLIVEINGRSEPSNEEIYEIVKASAGQVVHLGIERDGAKQAVDVTPVKMADGVRIGVQFGLGRRVGVAGAAVEGLRYCRDNAMLLFLTIKHLVRMDISARVLSGPIEIAQRSGESLRMGPGAFILLLAFVSIQLGVINLFPIPGLDGGHMLILIVEGIFRRELPDRVKQWVVTTGFAMLLLFAGVVMYYDVVKARTPNPDALGGAPAGQTQGTP